MTEALDRVPADEAGPGDIIAIAGIPEITIGETLADPDDPRPLPLITVDEPSHLDDDRHQHLAAGRARAATKLTARLVKNRLDAELVGNVSIRVLPTERPDTWEVQGRGELQLADPRRDDAPRGLRADRRQAAGGHPGRSTARCTSRSSG